MQKIKIILAVFLLSFNFCSNAQIREIPSIVDETFTKQYPEASDVEFKDFMVKVQVHFILEGEKMTAAYSNKGLWKGSEKEWEFEKLSDDIQDGLSKSKYGGEDWAVQETAVLYLPGGSEQYRVLVKKSDLQKKYLFFSDKGRLLRTSVTL